MNGKIIQEYIFLQKLIIGYYHHVKKLLSIKNHPVKHTIGSKKKTAKNDFMKKFNIKNKIGNYYPKLIYLEKKY